jgi:hypothetical protein
LSDTQYYEVDIEYTSGAKMVLLGKNEDDIRTILETEFTDIPNLKILSIAPADPELVQEAMERRAQDEAFYDEQKKKVN